QHFSRLGAVVGRPAGKPYFLSRIVLFPFTAQQSVVAGGTDHDAGCDVAGPGRNRWHSQGAGKADICDGAACGGRPGPGGECAIRTASPRPAISGRTGEVAEDSGRSRDAGAGRCRSGCQAAQNAVAVRTLLLRPRATAAARRSRVDRGGKEERQLAGGAVGPRHPGQGPGRPGTRNRRTLLESGWSAVRSRSLLRIQEDGLGLSLRSLRQFSAPSAFKIFPPFPIALVRLPPLCFW